MDYNTAAFLNNGERLLLNETVEQVGQKDGDQIDVTVHCNGGEGKSLRGRHHQVLLILFLLSVAALQFADGRNITITLLQSAVAKGAVCLDGTPPGYAHLQGYGDGADKWVVYLQGGGWCITRPQCYNTSHSRLGSSKGWFLEDYGGQFNFEGMLDDNVTFNPEFYNWNKFLIFYCDGSSFLSDKEEVDHVYDYNITYRGGRIYDAMMEELMVNKGMAKATVAILSGTSAGGLAVILHCDKFGALFNNSATKVRCLSDSGFFIHGMNFIGADIREAQWFDLIQTHGLTDLLPSSCTAKFSPTLCLFPENLVPDIQTPLFLIESAFDRYQLRSTLYSPPPPEHWINCIYNLMLCNWTDYQIMKEFRTNVITTLKGSLNPNKDVGYYVHSCIRHGHIISNDGWALSSLLANKTIAQAFGDWYFDRATVQQIDVANNLPRNCTP